MAPCGAAGFSVRMDNDAAEIGAEGTFHARACRTIELLSSPAAGGMLALVQNGDIIELDVAKRKLELKVSSKEISRRKKAWKKPRAPLPRGYWKQMLYPFQR